MILSQKQTNFSDFFAAFLKSRVNFKHFEIIDDSYSFCSSEIMDSKNVVRKMSKKSCFRGSFDKQHGKHVQALLKSSSEQLYHIH